MRRVTALAVALGLWAAPAALAQPAAPQSPYEEVVVELLAALQQMTKTLTAVRDEAGATAARPELKKSAELFVAVRAKAEKLKPPDLAERNRIADAYQKKLADAVQHLRTEMQRVRALPGGADALQELAILEPKKKDEPPPTKGP